MTSAHDVPADGIRRVVAVINDATKSGIVERVAVEQILETGGVYLTIFDDHDEEGHEGATFLYSSLDDIISALQDAKACWEEGESDV